jgi:hypothetical protein
MSGWLVRQSETVIGQVSVPGNHDKQCSRAIIFANKSFLRRNKGSIYAFVDGFDAFSKASFMQHK